MNASSTLNLFVVIFLNSNDYLYNVKKICFKKIFERNKPSDFSNYSLD